MEKIDIHNTEASYKDAIDNLMKDNNISPINKKLISSFLADAAIGKTARLHASVKILSMRARSKYLYNLKPFLRFFPKKSLKDLTKKDIENFVRALEENKIKTINRNTNYSTKTKSDIKKTVIILLRWLFGEGNKHHEMTYWIDTRWTHKDVPSLEEHQIKKMLDTCTKIQQKVLLACLFDGGFRIEEFLNVRNSDVRLVEGDAPLYKIMIRGQFSKTKGRDVSMFWSESYDIIKSWIATKNNILNPDEPFFDLGYRRCQEILAELGKKINVKLHPHLLRHCSATHYANKGLNEFQLNKRYGWSSSSDMGRKYVDSSKIDEKQQTKEYGDTKLAELRNQLRKQEEDGRIRREEMDVLKRDNIKFEAMFNELKKLRDFLPEKKTKLEAKAR